MVNYSSILTTLEYKAMKGLGHRCLTHLQGSTSDLLNANHVKGKEEVKGHDCLHHHLSKEVLLLVNQLAVEGGASTLLQDGTQLNRVLLVNLYEEKN